MVLADSNLVLPDVASVVGAHPWVFATAVPVALTGAVAHSRWRAHREQAPPAMAASVALLLVRLWIGLFVLVAPFALLGLDDRSLGDRLEFQEYGYSVPAGDGEVEWHDGPWLVLHHDAEIQICSQQSRPYPADDPPVSADSTVCPAAKVFRKAFGDVDIDGLRLVRQVERPAGNVESRVSRLVWAGFFFVLLGAVALERILRLTALRRPFSSGAVLWLRVLALAVAGATIVVPALTDHFVDGLIRKYFDPAALAGMDDGFAVSAGSVAAVLLILVLAEVWRFGIRLQADADATV
ncbi:MAG: DUF2975 domain-containing protein [Solirubrobacteraceae bacterium]|nr:DUF2975 domain-containing protein [Solirubrobacteraceae bacterium]